MWSTNHAAENSAIKACIFSTGRIPPAVSGILSFTDPRPRRGLVFDFSKPEVRDFLIQTPNFFLGEVPDRWVSRMTRVSGSIDGCPGRWRFCQDLTSTVHAQRPKTLHHAEYWDVNPLSSRRRRLVAGFDTTLTDGLRIAIRDVIGSASVRTNSRST